MDWTVFAFFILVNTFPLQARSDMRMSDRLMRILKRRNFGRPHRNILRVPQYPNELPPTEPILPGHTLLRPSKGMLRSAVKFPLRDVGGAAVYGNLDNLGITYGKSPHRIRYSNFRKTSKQIGQEKTPIKMVIDMLRNLKGRGSLVVIEIDPKNMEARINEDQQRFNSFFEGLTHNDEDNSGSEVFDDLDALFQDSMESMNFRRHAKKSKSKYRNRGKNYYWWGNKNWGKKSQDLSSDLSSIEDSKKSEESPKDKKPEDRKGKGDKGKKDDFSSLGSDEDSSSSSIEKNPGNPYTIHKNKYKQNWIWNHIMDGDHMNINPYAPQLNSPGPSGTDLFFARKWWYFNQDDYKPLG